MQNKDFVFNTFMITLGVLFGCLKINERHSFKRKSHLGYVALSNLMCLSFNTEDHNRIRKLSVRRFQFFLFFSRFLDLMVKK